MPKKSRMLIEGTACPVCGTMAFVEVDGADVCGNGHVYDSRRDAEALQAAGIAAGFKLHFTKRGDA